jgi:1,4-dihydroxy-2-naphthoyl-CoA synthase
MVSAIFEPTRWRAVEGFSFTDITYRRAADSGTVGIAFNRPEDARDHGAALVLGRSADGN